jgi:Major tropism determinant N-terminal domain
MTTATQVQLRRGTAAQVAVFTGAPGEVTPDMTNKRLYLHDGTTVGGIPQASAADVAVAIATVSAGANSFLQWSTCT